MTDDLWTNFADQRPTECGLYWFRIAGKTLSDTDCTPEWVDAVRMVGMGRRDNELWPGFSHWDDYYRTIPAATQWRANDGAKEGDTRFPGLHTLGCPFCGRQPKIDFRSPWITARIIHAKEFSIYCTCGGAGSRYSYAGSLSRLIAWWNTRAPVPQAMLSALIPEGEV